MKQITFIHAADLHLDSPMTGLKHLPDTIYKRVRESTFTAFEKLTQAAIDRQVDFVILAGDLFDGEDRSLRAQSRLRNEMLKLEAKAIPVYIVHGNHDHLSGTWINLDMPGNVHFFSDQVEVKTLQTKSGFIVNIYGFSYPERHVYERKIADYRRQEGADFHIGILHGNEGGKTEHGNYAPFYLKELLEKKFDYWALGHIHKREVLCEDPPVVYPGNIQGRNRKETKEKGFYHVSLSDFDAKLDFIEASDVVWNETIIDAEGIGNFQAVLQHCRAAINQIRKLGKGTLLNMVLKNIRFDDSVEKRGLDEDLLELLQEDEEEEESFVWVIDLNTRDSVHIDKEHLMAEGEFYRELFDTGEQFRDNDQSLESLYAHPLGKKYLSSLSAAEKDQLLNQAENLLIQLLYPRE